jgi:molybdate transport system regulatory protein
MGGGMKIMHKVWLDQDGKAFGDGPYELLKRVERTDSLHQAANQMGMSYSKAWGLVRVMETRLGFLLLERKVGGVSGGGSTLTFKAKELMATYGQIRKEVEISIEKICQKHFRSVERGKK